MQVSNSKSIILLFIDDILKQIDVSHCLVKISSLKCLKSCVFIGEIFKDHDVTHGLAKILSLKFLKSPNVLSSWGIYLRTDQLP